MGLREIILASVLPFLAGEHNPADAYQKPAVYAQHSYGNEDLAGILKMAEASVATRPYHAIALYRRAMIERGPESEEAISRSIKIFGKIVDPLDYQDNKWHFRNAISFHDDVIQNHQGSKFIGTAYLESGRMIFDHIHYMPERLSDIISRYENAYQVGEKIQDNNLMAIARFQQGYIIFFSISGIAMNDKIAHALEIEAMKHSYKRSMAEKYFKEVLRLVPRSDLSQKAENFLQLLKKRE